MIWYKEKNSDNIIISTRVRLARNLEKYPFVNVMNSEGLAKATKEIEDAIINSNSTLADNFNVYHIGELDNMQKHMLLEKHLISPDMMRKPHGSVMISKDDNMSIMLMEEDHIRLQIILGGFRLDEAYDTANKVDDIIDENVKYAFDREGVEIPFPQMDVNLKN